MVLVVVVVDDLVAAEAAEAVVADQVAAVVADDLVADVYACSV